MPLTIPTHPIAVVPLKLWRPAWFDGVALVVGSVAPDLAYALYGLGVSPRTHHLAALVWWSLPVTLVLARSIRWAAPAVAVHLRLNDLGVLATVRHRWTVTVGSALIGAASHLGWDAVTHPHRVAALDGQAWPGTPWWGLLSDASNVAGFAVGAYLVVRILRSGRLRAWHGAAPARTPRPAIFWPVTGIVLVTGVTVVLARPVDWFAGQAVRVLLVVGLALFAGAVGYFGGDHVFHPVRERPPGPRAGQPGRAQRGRCPRRAVFRSRQHRA